MKIASGWRRMSATPPRFDSSFSSSASIEIRSFAGSRSSWASLFSARSSCSRWIRSEIVRQLVSRPPSQRLLTYGMPTRARLVANGVLRLLLRADEEHRAVRARRSPCAKLYASSSSSCVCGEVDDVDAAALGEDEALHLRVPAARLVAEVDAGLQQFLHGDDGHGSPFLRFGLRCSGEAAVEAGLSVRPPSTEVCPTGRGNVWTPNRSRDRGAAAGVSAQAERARSRNAARSGGSSEPGLDPLAARRDAGRRARTACRNWRPSPGSRDAVDRVADDRQVDRREMDADLVHPPRLERDAQQRMLAARARSTSKCVIASRGVLACRARCASRRPGRVRSAPRSGRCATAAVPARARCRSARARARGRARTAARRPPRERATTMQARRVAVEPVDDAGRCAARRRRSVPASASTSVPLAWPGAGVHDEPGRLVDHEQVLVLPRRSPARPAVRRPAPARPLGSSISSPPASR